MILLPALLLLDACSAGEVGELRDGFVSAPSDGEQEGTLVPYEVRFEGITQHEPLLEDKLREVSNALRLQDRPTATRAGLARRAEDDVERFAAVLRSLGFYEGTASFTVEAAQSGTGTGGNAGDSPEPEALDLVYHIQPGPVYLLADVSVKVRQGDEVRQRTLDDEELKSLGLPIGVEAEADPILLGEQQVVDMIRRQGHPHAKAGKRRVVADTTWKTLKVTYEVDAGPRADFGEVQVKGEREVDPAFIASYAEWERGERFAPEDVAGTRKRLAKTNLFESVTVQPAEKVTEAGEIPMEIHVAERKHRSIGGGVHYSTAEGPGAEAFWEHRNLLGSGERLRLSLEGSALEQGGEADFRKPQFWRDRQSLVGEAEAKNFDTEAFEGVLASGYLGLERELADIWSLSLGGVLEYSDLAGKDAPNEPFYLGGLRGIVRRDSTDNPLDPTEGSRLELALSPYSSLFGEKARFVQTSLTGSAYLSLDDDSRWIVAGRGRIGTIVGEELENLPPNKRFFSGGGGSVRGYEFQTLGPLDENNDPTGGRSTIDVGLELRARIFENFGLVPFIEGGNVYEDIAPSDLDLFWAAGLGVRYYTDFGPLRFDVAIPLDQRENVDDDFQLYFSIGQAF